jgi:hypothetical protein
MRYASSALLSCPTRQHRSWFAFHVVFLRIYVREGLTASGHNENVAEQTQGLRAAAALQVCGYSWVAGTRCVKMTGDASRRLEALLHQR